MDMVPKPRLIYPFKAPPRDIRPIVISGPAGVGKGALASRLSDEHVGIFALAVSHTTREPRQGEVEGKSYFFVDLSTFDSLLSQGAFVEHSTFNNNHYGTARKAIADEMEKGMVVVLDVEMCGVQQLKANPDIDARYVFIKPPSLEALKTQLCGRGIEEDKEIQQMLEQAKTEIDYATTSQGVYDKVIVNDYLEKAYQELEEFVYNTTSN